MTAGELIEKLKGVNTRSEYNDFGFGYVYEYAMRFVQEHPEYSEIEDCFGSYIDERQALDYAKSICEDGTLMQLSNAVSNLYKAHVYYQRITGQIRNIDDRDVDNLISDIIEILE